MLHSVPLSKIISSFVALYRKCALLTPSLRILTWSANTCSAVPLRKPRRKETSQSQLARTILLLWIPCYEIWQHFKEAWTMGMRDYSSNGYNTENRNDKVTFFLVLNKSGGCNFHKTFPFSVTMRMCIWIRENWKSRPNFLRLLTFKQRVS